MKPTATLSAKALHAIDPQQGIILDVRTAMEHAEKHIALEHTHMPLDQLNPTELMMRHGLGKDAPVYLLCRSGGRSQQAAEKFLAQGYSNVKVVEGGLAACEDCGHAIKGHSVQAAEPGYKVQGPISLERQVRIAAGLLATTGAALALILSPWFALLSLFVGFGLMYAGLTDRCGMALLLTKAPWNTVRTTPRPQEKLP